MPRNLSTGEVVPALPSPLPPLAPFTHSTAVTPKSASAGAMTFEQVIEKYHGRVFQLVYRYTGDYEEACDLTQDTFVRAFAAWGEFRGDSQIYTWLYRIALNLCHNQGKRSGRRRRMETPLEIESEDGPTQQPIADGRPAPFARVENRELRAHINGALKELPDNYRAVIVLRDVHGLSYDEIARATDSTLEAIKSRLFRARGAMRRLLSPYLHESSAGEPSALDR